MAVREVSVVMRATYQGDLSKKLRQDEKRLEAFQRVLDKKPLIIPVKLDIAGARSQAEALRKAILGEFAKASPGIVGADGRTASVTAARELAKAHGLLASTQSRTFDKNGNVASRYLTQIDQIGNGLERISRFKIDPVTGNATLLSDATKDVRTVRQLEDGLRGINRELARQYSAASGRGDKAGQLAALKEQHARVQELLGQAAMGGLGGSAPYIKAENQLDRLGSKIAGVGGRQESAIELAARKARTREIANQITEEQRATQEKLKANKLEADAAERIPERARREAEINRVFDERKRIFDESRDRFRAIDKALQGEGRHDLADRAMRGGLGAQNQANQAELDKHRLQTDSMREAAREQEKIQKENQRAAERAQRLADQAASRSGNRNFGRALRLEDYATKAQLRSSEADMEYAKGIPDRGTRELEINRILSERALIYQKLADRMERLAVQQRALGSEDAMARSAKAEAAALRAREAAGGVGVQQVTYRLNVGDLAGVLNRLNSISNNYNVTVDDMFEGIVRVAGVAKETGMSLRDLEGIIGAVTGATGRPGQEIGNAMKFILTRLADPNTTAGLKKSFNFDVTGPNGDLKDMSQIMAELADIFPKLNNAQKEHFLSLTAGARQAARFALVLDNYRQAQILAAQASFDSESVFNENKMILASLESRVASLSSAWTKLFTAMGDSGMMDVVTGGIKAITDGVNDLGASILWLEQKAGAKQGSQSEVMFRVGKSMTKTMLNPIWGIKSMIGDYREMTSPDNNGFGKTGDEFKNQLDMQTARVNALRERLTGLQRGANVAESMDNMVGPNMDKKAFKRDFENMANLTLSLPNGTNIYADAMRKFYEAADTGDLRKLHDLLKSIRRIFTDQINPTRNAFGPVQKQAVEALNSQIAQFNQQKRGIMEEPQDGTPAQRRDRTDRLLKVQGQIKETESARDQVMQNGEEIKKSIFSQEQVAAMNSYMDDLMTKTKAFADAFKDFSPDPDHDPVTRIFQRRRNAAELSLDALLQVQRLTGEEANSRAGTAGKRIAELGRQLGAKGADDAKIKDEIEARQKIIDQADAAKDTIETRIRDQKEILSGLLKELDYQEKIAALQRQQTDSAKESADSSRAWRYGFADSDKDAFQAGNAVKRANDELRRANKARDLGMETPASRADSAGRVLQDEATARANLESMQRRQYDLAAARKQIEFDTVKAVREQTEEATKRLMLASREDQLRAAALKRTLRDRGPVTGREFMALSAESRKAFVDYLPNNAPGLLNDARANKSKAVRDIEQESDRLTRNFTAVSNALAYLESRVNGATAKGGTLDVPNGVVNPTADLNIAANQTRDQAPIVNINLGTVAVSVQLAEQVGKLMETYVDTTLKAGLRDLEIRLTRAPAPNSQGTSE